MHMGDRATATTEHLVSWAEFVQLPEDDIRELIDGRLVEVEVPGKLHERIVATLIHNLRQWAIPRQAGEVLGSGYKVRIDDRRGVMPDVQLVSPETWRSAPDEGLDAGRPELVIEVVSRSSRRYDRVTKLRWYASIGVPEYWIVDPEQRTLERLVLREGAYLIFQVVEHDDVFRPESFDGLALPLAELWADRG